MSWARVDDGWWCHPKVMGLSLGARGLWISALSWSCAHRSPEVPKSFLPMVGGEANEANELVASGLWVVTDDGWCFHDWGTYQDISARRAEAGRKGGQRSGEVRRSKAEANEANPVFASEANVKQTPKQARPVPSRPEDHPLHDPAVDNVLALIVLWRTKQAQAAGKVKNPTAYERTVAADVETLRPKVAEALERFDANPHAIAEYVEGRRDPRYLPKRIEAAS